MNTDQVKQRMTKAIEALRQDLAALKAGRATPAMVEQIVVEAYETRMTLVELATISAPEPSQLLITPFDQSIIRNIERAISLDRGLGLSPVIDGEVIRVNIPPLTAERRQALVKQVSQKLEAARIVIRQIRGDEMRQIRDAYQENQISEDDKFRQEEELQKVTDEFNKKIEEVGKQKEAELTTV